MIEQPRPYSGTGFGFGVATDNFFSPLRSFPALCIAGTDTDAGKTTVSAALLLAARKKGFAPVGIKPVQTGCAQVEENESGASGMLAAPDVAVYLDACPSAHARALLMLEEACSPHLAAANLGTSIDVTALARSVEDAVAAAYAAKQERDADSASDAPLFTVIESAGGVMTPLNDSESMLDLFTHLRLPVLLVVGNRLGAINQALLSVAALQQRGIPLAGFVLSYPNAPGGFSETGRSILSDNGFAISRMAGIPLLAELPYLPDLSASNASLRRAAWQLAANAVSPALDSLISRSPQNNRHLSGKHPDGGAGESLPCRESPERAEPSRAAGGISPNGLSLLQFDREHIWHPYTSALHPLTAREAVRTEGTRIVLADGRELVDGMSSWWCAVHGYNHPKLLRVLHEQADRMPHVMFGGLTHEPAVALAQRLLDMVPEGLEHAFFADSGSVAVEVALKMALQYQQAQGRAKKRRLLTVRGGYHGDTLGAMAVCDPETGMHSLFKGLLAEHIFAPRPECRFDAEYDPAAIREFARLLEAHAEEVAAVVLEPVVQGAGGMWLYHPQYLRRVSELCREHDCLLILDEIATGFGRTGKMFACEWAGISPDILCLGKALTGGVMTLSATLASARVAQGISQDGGVLMHGPTFMANPLACAVAGASLDLLLENDCLERVRGIEVHLREGLKGCRDLPGVADVRVLGAIGVLEMERPVRVEDVQAYFIEKHGCWIRPFGRNMYVMPPFVASSGDIARLCAALRGAVEDRAWE
jgi:adenosylmethionine-8-amino-7-oxononanoate aminotransferase